MLPSIITRRGLPSRHSHLAASPPPGFVHRVDVADRRASPNATHTGGALDLVILWRRDARAAALRKVALLVAEVVARDAERLVLGLVGDGKGVLKCLPSLLRFCTLPISRRATSISSCLDRWPSICLSLSRIADRRLLRAEQVIERLVARRERRATQRNLAERTAPPLAHHPFDRADAAGDDAALRVEELLGELPAPVARARGSRPRNSARGGARTSSPRAAPPSSSECGHHDRVNVDARVVVEAGEVRAVEELVEQLVDRVLLALAPPPPPRRRCPSDSRPHHLRRASAEDRLALAGDVTEQQTEEEDADHEVNGEARLEEARAEAERVEPRSSTATLERRTGWRAAAAARAAVARRRR